MDFLWHRVSEKEKEEIKKQAQKIMNDFSKKLDGVKGEVEDVDDKTFRFGREERDGKSLEIDRDIMFKNALNKNKDFIIAEKGEW